MGIRKSSGFSVKRRQIIVNVVQRTRSVGFCKTGKDGMERRGVAVLPGKGRMGLVPSHEVGSPLSGQSRVWTD
jgi:hypothetical protein